MFGQTQYWLLRRNRKKLYQMSKPYDTLKARWPQCPATLAAIRMAGQHDQEQYSGVEQLLYTVTQCNTAKVYHSHKKRISSAAQLTQQT